MFRRGNGISGALLAGTVAVVFVFFIVMHLLNR